MKHFTTHSLALVVAIIIASSMAVAAQQLAGKYDDSTEYFDSKKHNKWHRSANFTQALAMLNNVDEEEDVNYEGAVALLEKELKQHPGNGYALCNAAVARINEENMELNKFVMELLYGNNELSADEAQGLYEKRLDATHALVKEAIAMLEKGIELLPAADRENRCKAHIACGNLQDEVLDESDKALAAYEQAAAALPCYQSYDKLLKFHLQQGNSDQAVFYASKLGNMIDGDNEALLLLAQLNVDNNDYDKAEELINKAVANDASDKDAQQLLITILIKKGRYREALDKIIEVKDVLEGDELLVNLSILCDMGDDCKAMVVNRLHQLEAEAALSRNDSEQEVTEWEYFEGVLHYSGNDYRTALTCFDKLLERKPSLPLLSLKAHCHYMLGDAPTAISILDYALRAPYESGETNLRQNILGDKIRYEMLCGMTDEYIYDSEVYCKAFGKESAAGYEGMARGYLNKGQYARALEVCEEWMEQFDGDIEPKYFHAFVLAMWGKTNMAHEEMRDIINDEGCSQERRMFALFYMGQRQESRALLDKMAQISEAQAAATSPASDDAMQAEVMSFYNLACAYSLHGDIDRALHFLERYYAEAEGVTDFGYAILDDELNNARKDPRFMEIVNRYKQQWLDGKLNLKK